MQLSQAIADFGDWRKFKTCPNTNKGYDLTLKQFCIFCRDKDIEDVGLKDVMDWFNLMRELGYDINSFIPKAIALRKLFEFYKQQDFKVLDSWLIPVPNREFKNARVATEDDYRTLLENIPTKTNDPRHIRNLALVGLLWDTGARNGELLSLNIKDLDLENKRAVIRTEKNRGSKPFRTIFWSDDTNDKIKNWIKKKELLGLDNEALFVSLCNVKIGERLSIKGVGELLRQYSKKAGLENMNAHSFRHHLGHEIIKQGGSNSDVANILGHASLQSTMVYTRMSDPEIENRYRKLIN